METKIDGQQNKANYHDQTAIIRNRIVVWEHPPASHYDRCDWSISTVPYIKTFEERQQSVTAQSPSNIEKQPPRFPFVTGKVGQIDETNIVEMHINYIRYQKIPLH